ncbi:MAG: phosphoribosylformylglycinamidine synthase subunit PurL [Candidatus Magasanikbacteria bacterium CG10_big_fil_rev_8_21_14_0_10_47_10]|uniref:Phosphoribosylformylglycinamidine synthase subunit PurL n=1 Tax=Candidatus Magasanikbacteria bacterium CG10_big_fil_rev_8_21_14_0_10_47_10 TaxID=1974652 RepID=A0A2H0TPS1_9BACT|nr:MAG: phosphoribosylformylglycinamidine synthase subunit PurL [Candidatus Magasanikbacteria bacterium CG10_big_fil_rev_8_21_14_0_10_47_10]
MAHTVDTIDVLSLDDAQLQRKFLDYKIQLTRDEAEKIQRHILNRPPTVTELILWSIQGSEHCSYKSTRHLLKQFVTDGPNVILGPGEDAGIVEISRDTSGQKYGIVMSHESHNHPSQIVPYEGAATGIGGNVRDVACMGAKVIACADSLRFGALNNPKTGWIHEGVIAGIAGYGNPIGVPNIAGDAYYDESYNENCLVNVVTLGVLGEHDIIHSRAPEHADGFDIILVGKPTDNSGFGGASFASVELADDKKDQNKGAVQEPNAFLKRHLLKATYGLFELLKEKNLIHAVGFKDLGAGGIACAAVELADSAGMGAIINLDQVFVGMNDLDPSVILCSETQERFMWVAPPDITDIIVKHYNHTFSLPHIAKGAMAKVIGTVTDNPKFIATYQGQYVVDAPARAVTAGLKYERPFQAPQRTYTEPDRPNMSAKLDDLFLQVLSHQHVSSRSPIYERYDKQVQGITVIEPGHADAGVMRPFHDPRWPAEIKKIGIALSVDHNPRYCKISPYWGAVNAVAEACRNVAAVGATPWALTDCLNFGNPEKPDQMWEFVEAVRGISDAQRGIHIKDYLTAPIPIISGNVSLYNESGQGAIAPSPVIACLGRLRDVSRAITMAFKQQDSAILLVGERKDECGGSVYYDIIGELGANVPKPVLRDVEAQIFALTDAIYHGYVLAAHDISDGGVAACIAEMCFDNMIGVNATIPGSLDPEKLLFGESGGFVIQVKKERVTRVEEIFQNRGAQVVVIGETTESERIELNGCIDVLLTDARYAWDNGLRKKLL